MTFTEVQNSPKSNLSSLLSSQDSSTLFCVLAYFLADRAYATVSRLSVVCRRLSSVRNVL